MAANNLTDAGTSVSYLPFAHVAERMLSMYLPYVAGGHVRLLADASELARDIARTASHPILRRSPDLGEDSNLG